MDGCKKKLDAELETNFPHYFGSDVTHVEKLREYEELKLRKYLGEEVDNVLEVINQYFLEKMTPKIFNPYDENCIIIETDKRMEDLINSIEENGLTVKSATVFEFYSKVQYLEKKAQKLKQHHR